MSRRYRFLTNPRFFSFFTEKRMNLVEFSLIFVTFASVFNFAVLYFDSQFDRAREATLEARVEKARAEVRRLKAAETKRNGTPLSTSASIKGSSETAPTAAALPPDDNVAAISTDAVEVRQSGILKGVPLDVAKEIQEEYRLAHMARATRYNEWDLRRKAHRERHSAFMKKDLAFGEDSIADAKKRREHLLAVFAMMSPEQLEAERKEALKTQPAEVVDSFFKQLAEFTPTKSPEQIEQEAQDLQKNGEALAIARRQLAAEREQLEREREEINRTKPPLPNLGLDEFYTEWKKRNRTKPKP